MGFGHCPSPGCMLLPGWAGGCPLDWVRGQLGEGRCWIDVAMEDVSLPAIEEGMRGMNALLTCPPAAKVTPVRRDGFMTMPLLPHAR